MTSSTPRPATVRRSPVGRGLVTGAAVAGVAAASALASTSRLRRRRPSTTTAHAGIATSDGLRLHATTHGPAHADAAVVLAHGWTMSSEFWTPAAEALARQGLRTVTYDQRGHGRSGVPSRLGFDLAHLGRDLAAVLDATVPEGMPVVLVGHSMGAMAVMAWAAHAPRRPGQVRGALLANTSMHRVLPDAVAAITGLTHPGAAVLLRQVVRVPVPLPSTPANRRLVRHIAFGEQPDGGAVDLTHRLFMSCSPTVRVGFARQIDGLDLRHGAAALDVPTLVLAGTHDRLTPPSHAQSLVDVLPRGRLQVLPGAGHQTPLERPADTVEVIHDHVRRTLAAEDAEARAEDAAVLPVAGGA